MANLSKSEEQMPAGCPADASLTGSAAWKSIDFQQVRAQVRRLQVRIAKARQEGKWRKVRALQWLLTRSRAAKLLAIRRVTSNRGRRTPGVDGVIWSRPTQKWEALNQLVRRGYRARPLRRTYIPKRNGKKRPLGIPTMRDRAMQALYKLALEPVAETQADPNSYGFRSCRSQADAIQQCFKALAKRYSARWVLEGDIRACFDGISHRWLEANIPMDRRVLRQWLKAGYIEDRTLFPTVAGTPQGGVISPLLANLTLDGLEAAVHAAVPNRMGSTNIRSKVNVIRYADDFVITGISRELLEDKVLPVVRSFLAERGLELSEEKTRISRIEDGIDFLGQTLRKHGDKLLIRPTCEAQRAIRDKLGETLRQFQGAAVGGMIAKLNRQIRGWANYHRHVASATAFRELDQWLYRALWRWMKRRHSEKGPGWLRKKYWSLHPEGWFAATEKTKLKGTRLYTLIRATSIRIVRHVKVKGEAHPFDPAWDGYFARRRAGHTTYPARGGLVALGLS